MKLTKYFEFSRRRYLCQHTPIADSFVTVRIVTPFSDDMHKHVIRDQIIDWLPPQKSTQSPNLAIDLNSTPSAFDR